MFLLQLFLTILVVLKELTHYFVLFFIIFCYKSLACILWISFFQVLSHT